MIYKQLHNLCLTPESGVHQQSPPFSIEGVNVQSILNVLLHFLQITSFRRFAVGIKILHRVSISTREIRITFFDDRGIVSRLIKTREFQLCRACVIFVLFRGNALSVGCVVAQSGLHIGFTALRFKITLFAR